MIEQLVHIDKSFFVYLCEHWYTPFLDTVMPFIRNAVFWGPLYAFMAAFITINFKKTGWKWLAFWLLAVGCSDFISSGLIKHWVMRTRPINDEQIAPYIHYILNSFPPKTSYSFTSSHAANHFCLATFVNFTLQKTISKWFALFYVWAAIICVAQVYVGVHYPLDVLCGGILGFAIGYGFSRLFKKIVVK